MVETMNRDRSCRACRQTVTARHRTVGIVCTAAIVAGWDYQIIRRSDWPAGWVLGAAGTWAALSQLGVI